MERASQDLMLFVEDEKGRYNSTPCILMSVYNENFFIWTTMNIGT